MINQNSFLESVWDGILCRQRERIIQTYQALDAENQLVVKNHLQSMTTGSGWHPEQVKSARFALKTILSMEKK